MTPVSREVPISGYEVQGLSRRTLLASVKVGCGPRAFAHVMEEPQTLASLTSTCGPLGSVPSGAYKQVRRPVPVVPDPKKWSQEDHEFKATCICIVSSEPA